MFTIEAGKETTEVRGRNAAIETAKRLSRQTWRAVHIERDDERVMMQYRRGKLQAYKFEARHRSRRGS